MHKHVNKTNEILSEIYECTLRALENYRRRLSSENESERGETKVIKINKHKVEK
jgi:hypothetical protein